MKKNNKEVWIVSGIALLVLMFSVIWLFFLGEANIHDAYGKTCLYAVIMGTLTFSGFIIGKYKYEFPIHKLYWICAVGLGAVLLFAEPVFSVPDEEVHFSNAYDVSNRIMFDDVGDSYSTMRLSEWFPVYKQTGISKSGLEEFQKAFFAKEDHSLLTWGDDRKSTGLQILYVVGGLGITIGRLLNLNFVAMAILGQLLNLLFFATVVSYAIKKIPYGKRLLAVIGLLPMVIQQAASFSYDVEINGAAFLLISLSLAFATEKPKIKDMVIYLLAAAVLYKAKAHIYFILVLISVVFVWKKQWIKKEHKNRWLICSGIFAIGLILICVVKWNTVIEQLKVTPYISRLGEEGYSPYYYITHFQMTVSLFFNTILHRGSAYIYQMIGGGFGWFQIFVNTGLVFLFVLLLIGAAVRRKNEPTFGLKKRILVILPCIFMLILVFCAMMFYETGKNSLYIEGVQGRYFLPVLLPVLLGVGFWRKPVLPEKIREDHFLMISAAMLYIVLTNYLYLIP